MREKRFNKLLMTLLATTGMLVMGAGMAMATHPDIPLYTYEEVASQFDDAFAGGVGAITIVPVMLDENYKGFPYSTKQTCGNCHNGGLTRNDGMGPITDAEGAAIVEPLVSYDEMDSGTFHVQQDANAMVEDFGTSSQAGKPWTQSVGMAGKW
ncbi:MAG: hypothetical protein C0622_11700 [Desulfuromonas sp.]|nr:MAG: hypothetical protein C0622_11700 [Desulfuromonas sp.]